MKRLRLVFGALCLLGLGMDKFRALRPEPSANVPVRMPRLEKRTLPNGLELVVHQDSYLPLVHIRLLLRTGFAAEPPEQKGVLLLLYRALFSENVALIRALDPLGTTPSLQLSRDGASISVEVQSDDATTALAALARAVREPDWGEVALDRLQQRAIYELTERDVAPATAATEALNDALYPTGHPLHRDRRTLATSIARRTLEDLQQAYHRHVVAKNLGVTIAGRMAPVVAMAWVKRELGTLSKEPPPVVIMPLLTPPLRREILVIPYPGLSQTVIAMGISAPQYDAPQSPALQAAASWLSAHVSAKLREDKTFSYGLSAQYLGHWLGGEVVIQGSVAASATGYATREILSQLFATNSGFIEPTLMPLYRALLINQITESYATLESTASAADSVLRRSGDFNPQRIEQIKTMDAFGVLGALREFIPGDRLAIVLAGDPQLIEQQVKSLGLGTLRIISPP